MGTVKCLPSGKNNHSPLSCSVLYTCSRLLYHVLPRLQIFVVFNQPTVLLSYNGAVLSDFSFSYYTFLFLEMEAICRFTSKLCIRTVPAGYASLFSR